MNGYVYTVVTLMAVIGFMCMVCALVGWPF